MMRRGAKETVDHLIACSRGVWMALFLLFGLAWPMPSSVQMLFKS